MGVLGAEALQQATRGFEHKEQHYVIDKIGSAEWKITDDAGRNLGTLVLRAPSGEEDEPVFAVSRPASDLVYMEGSDWEALLRALINETEST